MQPLTLGWAISAEMTCSPWEKAIIPTPMASSRSRSKAVSIGSWLPASSARVLPAHSGLAPLGTSETMMPSAPAQDQKLSQLCGGGASSSAFIRARSAGSERRRTVASKPPAWAQGGRMAPIMVLPAV